VGEGALERLRPEDKALIVARIEMGLPYPEIAAMFGKQAWRPCTWPSAGRWSNSQRRWRMSANADDPLIQAAARISDGTPVDWRRIRELLTNRNQETIADELEALEQVARASGGEAAVSWGRVTLVEVIGRGKFGTVYRALDPTLQIPVALKIIRPRPGAVFDYNHALQEAQRLARIRHPDVVRVFAAERVGDEVGVSMELVEGQTLDAIVRERGPFSARAAAVIGLDLCRALAAVHGAGLLHGDARPTTSCGPLAAARC
jgi:hypothetical protein